MIVIYFLILILIILFLYLKVQNEYFNSVPVDTIDSVSKHECYLIIDTILDNINTKYNKNLVRGNLDRVEKTVDTNKLNYKINVFIYNTDKDTNKKVCFDVDYDNKQIILNSIKNGDSIEVLNIESVNKNNELKNNFSYVSFKETPYKMVTRTNDILDTESQQYDNKREVFNYDNRIALWDPFGVPIESEDDRVLRNVPNFIVSNFTAKNDLYHWLFDPAQDSASRPIGT